MNKSTLKKNADLSKHYTKQGLFLKARYNDKKVVSDYVKFLDGVK